MSKDKPKKNVADGTDLFFGIVAARYNGELVEQLLDRVKKTLRAAKVSESSIKILRVPGSAELPYVANMLALTDEYDCVITLGVIIAGETMHNEIIAQSTAVALQDVALQTGVPVINGILSVNNENQAAERITGAIDRGAEFAHAALEMAWHRVHLGDYLEELEAQRDQDASEEADAELEKMFKETNELFDNLGLEDDDEDDDFDMDNPPFNKN